MSIVESRISAPLGRGIVKRTELPKMGRPSETGLSVKSSGASKYHRLIYRRKVAERIAGKKVLYSEEHDNFYTLPENTR